MLNVIKAFRVIIKDFIIELLEREGNRRRLKARLIFIDGSTLRVKDYHFGDQRKYAYHWTNVKGKLIIRWDNAPHWPWISTFPHHKHVGSAENLEPSLEMSLVEVLTVIEGKILASQR